MISVDRVVKPGLQRSFIARNSGTAKNFAGHAASQGAIGKSKTALEASWLVAKGAPASGKNLSELWSTYLVSKGFTAGSLKDRMKAFFTIGTQA